MPANAVVKSFVLGLPTWTKLANSPTVVQATVIADPKNAGNISVRFRGGITTSWPPGAAVSFESVDLSEIEVRGAPNYKVLVAAYAPGTHPRGRSALHLGTKYVVEQAEAIPNEGEGEIGIG
ncbi:MAG: hypothetical protein LC135_05035 [Phycisphaerae bacterium]|nr:hypothetical protein [Phycisphaerae bacterium]MCZ2399217.1 hypothetical protein [Phycisphaerae bacterium]